MTERRGERPAAAKGRRFPAVPIAGDLLVSSVALQGDAFDQTVIMVLDVNEAGSLGVVLNRETDTDVDDILPGWGSVVCPPGLALCGGPVALDGALCLGRLRDGASPPAEFRHSFGRVGLVPLDADPVGVAPAFASLRIFVGHAGWEAGQLEGELSAGLWHVLPGRGRDVFDPAPGDLWRRVLRRVRGELAYFSTWTADPELN